MSAAYVPTCPACRSYHPNEFHRSCEGCRVRQANAVAQQQAALVTDKQVSAMDSTMEPLPSEVAR